MSARAGAPSVFSRAHRAREAAGRWQHVEIRFIKRTAMTCDLLVRIGPADLARQDSLRALLLTWQRGKVQARSKMKKQEQASWFQHGSSSCKTRRAARRGAVAPRLVCRDVFALPVHSAPTHAGWINGP
eukprot:1695782-Prymnesium_polylepis.1